MNKKTKVTISGSYRKHMRAILQAKELLEKSGAEVLRPATDKVAEADGWVRLANDPADRGSVQQLQLDSIRQSHMLYVVNPGGYVGGSAMLECGYAYGIGVPVCFAEIPHEAATACLREFVGSPQAALRHLLIGTFLPVDEALINRWVENVEEHVGLTGVDLRLAPRDNAVWLVYDGKGVAQRQKDKVIFDTGGTPVLRDYLRALLKNREIAYEGEE